MRQPLTRGWLAALLLSGCAIQPPAPQPLLPLLAPATLDQSLQALQALQLVVAKRGDWQQKLLFAVEADDQAVTVSALTTLGVALQTIRYDGQTLTIDEHLPGASDALNGRFLLADLQLAAWPLAAVAAALPAGLTVSDGPCSGAHHCRYLRREGTIQVEVRYQGADLWQAATEINQRQLGYQLQISTMEYGK